MLVLELLGSLSLGAETGVVPLAAQQKRPLGLLAILALAGRQGLSRHRIEAYLWPESTAARARHALDQAVYAIRRTLGGDVILSTGQELRLNPEIIRADVWNFDDAFRGSQWASVAAIYKGALLDGFHFADSRELESWIDAERARLLLAYQTAMEFLANRSAEEGDHSQGVTWRRRLASSDPLAAGPTKKLILALAASGDRAGAVKEARQYQELVREELEMEPDSEIEGLASALSHPSDSDAAGAGALPRAATHSASSHQAVPAAAEGGSFEESDLASRILRGPIRADRSRMAALASFSVAALLVIAALIVRSVQGRASATAGQATRGESKIPIPAAREAYLRGISAWDDRTKEGNDQAVGYFRRATELDPEYAEAYAGLAEAYVRIGYFGYRPAEAMFPKAKAAAVRGMQLDSTLASARTALASELIWEHDFAGAEREYLKAITLTPTNATAHQWYGVLLMILRRIPEAVAEEKRAADLEPLSLQVQNNYATFINVSGDHAGALHQFQKTVAEEPDSAWVRRNPWVLANMSAVYADNGRYAEALQMMSRALKIIPRNPRALHTLSLIYREMGRNDLARKAFAQADTMNEQYAAYRGLVYGDESNADSAFAWFSREQKWGIQPMLSMQADWRLDPLRGDPRFRALIRRIGITNGN